MANTCGHHTELASNDAVKITRCTCGVIHMTLNASGVTVRVAGDAFRAATIGMKAAVERLDQSQPPAAMPTGSTSVN